MPAKPLCDLHGALEGLATDGFMHQALPLGLARIERLSHEDVHEGRRRSYSAWQPLSAAGTWQQADLGFGKTDQVVAVLGDSEIAGEGELEGPGKGGPGDRGDDRLGHALAK